MEEIEQKRDKWYWPTIVDIDGAIAASNKGVWAAGVVSALTFIAASASFFVSTGKNGIDPWAYIDALFFAVIAWGIYRRSRTFAVIGLVLFVVEKIFSSPPSASGFLV